MRILATIVINYWAWQLSHTFWVWRRQRRQDKWFADWQARRNAHWAELDKIKRDPYDGRPL